MPRTILILDPDRDTARLLAEQLDEAGLAVTAVTDATAAHDQIARGEVAGLVAAGLDASELTTLAATLRRQPIGAALILLGTADEAEGLAALGADEVFVRPLRIGALISRLRGLLEAAAPETLAIGPYRFDGAAKRLSLAATGTIVHLTEKETEILLALARAGATAVPREQLLSEVWQYNPEVTTHTLETHVYRLRQKMETAAAPGPFLLTEPGGYRLVLG